MCVTDTVNEPLKSNGNPLIITINDKIISWLVNYFTSDCKPWKSGNTIKAVQRKNDENALQIFTNDTGIVGFLIHPSVIVVRKQTLCEIIIDRNN